MRIRPTLTLFLLCAFAAAPSLAAPPTLPATWSAHEAVRFALANSPDSKIGEQRLIAAQAAIDLERAAMAPQVTLSSEYSQTDAAMYSFGNILNQGRFKQSINFNDPGRTDSLSAGLQVGYRLYNGGRDQAGVLAASSAANASRMDLAAVRARLAFEVIKAFHGLAQAAEVILAEQAAVEAVTASLANARARHEAGVLLQDAVLDLEVQQSRAKENLIQAQHRLALARRVFLTLLGVEAGSTAIVPAADGDQEIPSATGAGTRFEIRHLEAMIEAAEARVRQAKAAASPTVDGFAGYQVEGGSITGGSGDSWQAGVKLQYALSDGHRTSAQVAKSLAQVAELREERRKLILGLGLEVEQARLSLRETEERLAVSEKSVAQAKESAEINRARFNEGVVLSSDLIAVENRLTEAMIRRTMAQTARRIAIADLRRAVGLPQFADLVEEQVNEENRATR